MPSPQLVEPLVFEPIIKHIRWGGTRLASQLGKSIGNRTDAAESWEIVDHGADQSVVAGGAFAGHTLSDLLQKFPADLFGVGQSFDQFPLLIKFLDASDRLSVQVHPNDERAKRYDPTENGKTETWIILDAGPDSVIYAGLKAGVDRRQLERTLREGTVESILHRVPINAGDSIFIPAGTVHAIGEGILLAEVQQSSDLTFRLYDWGRVGADGNPRPIHVEESLAVTDFAQGPVEPLTPAVLSEFDHHAEALAHCDYFEVRRHRFNQRIQLPLDRGPAILMILEGAGEVQAGQGRTELSLGNSTLIPAACESMTVVPSTPTTLLEVTLGTQV